MASTSPQDSKKRLALAIIDFLSTSLNDGTLTAEDKESIEIAQSCIADTFHVDPTNKSHLQDAIGDQSLLQIYSVYEKLKGKSTPSTTGPSSAKEARPSTPTAAKDGSSSKPSSSKATETTPEAENFKSLGNTAMQRKDYPAAIDLYSKAIAISPLNPIYLSNRAAAYSASHQHAQASTDAEMAVAADPSYTKAWSRLGLARYVLGDAKGSMEAYQKGIEYEGNGGSEAMKKGFKTAKERVEKEEKEREDEGDEDEDMGESERGGGAPGGAGGMPDLSALAGMLGGGGRGGGGGGMPDLSSIMSNPMFASMAQNLMSNPDALQGLMNNPQLRGLADRFGGGGAGGGGGGAAREGADGAAPAGGQGGGGGGGMPDLASLMNDPSIAEMAKNFMGGQGRGAGR